MRLGRALAFVVVALVVWSGDAWAQGRRFFDTSSGVNRTQHNRTRHDGDHRDGRRDGHDGNRHHRHHHRFPGSTVFFPFGFFPSVAYPAPSYAPPLAFAYPSPSPEPPLVRVVYYATGRYVLYGDGMTSAYQWVWIPNAPSAPPPPPAAMPAPPPPSAPPEAPEQQPVQSAPRELWSWTDEQGTAHWTDRRDNIPERYRPAAQRRG